MKEYDDYSAKEKKQLAVCQRLITEKVIFHRRKSAAICKTMALTVSVSQPFHDYWNCWEVIKIRNTKRTKNLFGESSITSHTWRSRSVAEMVLSVEHNGEFILIHTVAGYGRAVARILDFHALPEILGVIAGSNIVWVAPRVVKRTALVHKQINYLLKLNI